MKLNQNEQRKISKSLSYVLRHRPDTIGLTLGEAGCVAVDDLLAAFHRAGKHYKRREIEVVVAENDKRRFELSDDGRMIRARQGHSVEVDLAYDPADPPDVLYHGTAEQFVESILAQGLVKAKRHDVHLSTDPATMRAVGMRRGKPVILAVDAGRMHRDGFKFFVTGNQVWLTDHVPPEYLQRFEDEG